MCISYPSTIQSWRKRFVLINTEPSNWHKRPLLKVLSLRSLFQGPQRSGRRQSAAAERRAQLPKSETIIAQKLTGKFCFDYSSAALIPQHFSAVCRDLDPSAKLLFEGPSKSHGPHLGPALTTPRHMREPDRRQWSICKAKKVGTMRSDSC